MIFLVRTDSSNNDFQLLVNALDHELCIRDGEDSSFLAELNKTDFLKYTIVAYENGTPVGSGAIRPYSNDTMEVKRMYVVAEKRGLGIATLILHDLEKWSKELHFKKCILETGKIQPEAISLYRKNNYRVISNYGHYAGLETSVCFEKELA